MSSFFGYDPQRPTDPSGRGRTRESAPMDPPDGWEGYNPQRPGQMPRTGGPLIAPPLDPRPRTGGPLYPPSSPRLPSPYPGPFPPAPRVPRRSEPPVYWPGSPLAEGQRFADAIAGTGYTSLSDILRSRWGGI